MDIISDFDRQYTFLPLYSSSPHTVPSGTTATSRCLPTTLFTVNVRTQPRSIFIVVHSVFYRFGTEPFNRQILCQILRLVRLFLYRLFLWETRLPPITHAEFQTACRRLIFHRARLTVVCFGFFPRHDVIRASIKTQKPGTVPGRRGLCRLSCRHYQHFQPVHRCHYPAFLFGSVAFPSIASFAAFRNNIASLDCQLRPFSFPALFNPSFFRFFRRFRCFQYFQLERVRQVVRPASVPCIICTLPVICSCIFHTALTASINHSSGVALFLGINSPLY